ncbi:4Fe-4S binding protein [Adlercreutzia sp. R21]|uniref:4Fe-4S binding protein n=1 Tax=Adlercreutzia wanghongyangiae TaxID=3111451 RepID=UPI002DB6C943|nr:4Fe-4S binding protein [Adlercreutzia sp. R21]MEC4183569.1 4Fe-4S binding protein [Adlercreutzia sp. R21]
MTNYRHGQMIHIIDGLDSPLLAVQPDRCVLVRNRNGECLRCASVCTTGAISLAEEGIVVSPDLCIGCGTCASACPTGCLAAVNPTDEELFAAVEGALARHDGRVAIACETACALAQRDADGDGAFAPGKPVGTTEDGRAVIGVVCLGRVDESLLIEATARRAQSIQLISGRCETCAHHCGGALCDEIASSATNLLTAMGVPSPLERLQLENAEDASKILRLRPPASAQDDTAGIPTEAERSGIPGGAHQASSAANAISPVGCRAERGLSERLSAAREPAPDEPPSEDCLSESEYPAAPTGDEPQARRQQAKPAPDESQAQRKRVNPASRTALVPGANKDFVPEFTHVQPDGTLPHFVPPRRLRLFNSLKALGSPQQSSVSTRLWGQVDINTELCRSCRMCTVFCPTGAISRFDAGGGAFGVEHRSALCMQCRLCEVICPEQAITVSDTVSTEEFLSGTKFRFAMQPIGWNPGAEDSIASRMARFIKVDNVQEPQAKVKSNDTAERRAYAWQRDARRREIRGE